MTQLLIQFVDDSGMLRQSRIDIITRSFGRWSRKWSDTGESVQLEFVQLLFFIILLTYIKIIEQSNVNRQTESKYSIASISYDILFCVTYLATIALY